MEFEGTVVSLLPQVKGMGARGEWVKQEVIFEQAGEFGKKLCVGFWGDKAQDAASLRVGEKVRVSANLESREYNGRWYTDVRAWKMDRGAANAHAAADPNAAYGSFDAAPHGGYGASAQGGGGYDWGAPASKSAYPSGADAQSAAASADEFDDLPF